MVIILAVWFQDNLPVIIVIIFAILLAIMFIALEEKFAPFNWFRIKVRRLRWFLRIPIWAMSMGVIVGLNALFQHISFLLFGIDFSVVPIFLVFLIGVTLALALLLPEEEEYYNLAPMQLEDDESETTTDTISPESPEA